MIRLSLARNDCRHALRMLRKNPVFTIAVVAILALGIGLNTAMFGVLDALLWKALPFPAASRLMSVEQRLPTGEMADAASYPDFLDWGKSTSFEIMAAWSEQEVVLAGSSHADRAFSEFVTPDYFKMFGLRTQLGRVFSAAEFSTEAPLAVISHALWVSKLGNASDVIGRSIRVNDKLLTIIGVLPPGSTGLLRHTDIWLPMKMIGLVSTPELLDNRAAFLVQVAGRLKPGVSVARAQAEFQSISRRLQLSYPETNNGRVVALRSLFEAQVGPVKDAILMLFGAVTLVFLIACFNVANLVLSRYLQRQREFAIRLALGASRSQLLGQVFIESLLMSLMGAAAGLLFAFGCVQVIRNLQVAVLENAAPLSFSATTVLYGMVVSVLGGLALGLAPALRFSFTRLAEILKSGERAGSSRWSTLMRDGLVFSQVVLATVLLIACGLMFRSLGLLYSIDPGFRSRDALAVKLAAMPPAHYAEPEQLTAYYWHILQRVQQISGVRTVGASMRLPLDGPTPSIPFVIKARTNADAVPPTVRYTAVSPNYFSAIGVTVKGQSFSERDVLAAQPVVIVNRTLARRYWPSGSPIGEYIKILDGEPRWRVIVGIADDVRSEDLTQPADGTVYVPFAQIPEAFGSILRNFPMSLILRTPVSATQMAASVKQAVADVDPDQVVLSIFPLRNLVTNAVRGSALYTQLLGLFAFGSLSLAAVGVYGVVSFAVIQRTQELGVRLALGATPGRILSIVLTRGISLVVPGVVMGMLGAFVLTSLMASLLFGVSRSDPLTFVSSGLALVAIGLLASLLPAIRAAHIDPKSALRHE